MILKGTSPYKIQSIVYKRYFDLDQSGGPTNRTSSCPTLTLVRKQNANSGLLFLLSSVNNQGATMSSSKKMGTPTCYAECSLYKTYSLFISFACQDGSKLVIKFLEAPDLGLFLEAPTETHHYTKCHNVTLSPSLHFQQSSYLKGYNKMQPPFQAFHLMTNSSGFFLEELKVSLLCNNVKYSTTKCHSAELGVNTVSWILSSPLKTPTVLSSLIKRV